MAPESARHGALCLEVLSSRHAVFKGKRCLVIAFLITMNSYAIATYHFSFSDVILDVGFCCQTPTVS